jgi:hypothetical protein
MTFHTKILRVLHVSATLHDQAPITNLGTVMTGGDLHQRRSSNCTHRWKAYTKLKNVTNTDSSALSASQLLIIASKLQCALNNTVIVNHPVHLASRDQDKLRQLECRQDVE